MIDFLEKKNFKISEKFKNITIYTNEDTYFKRIVVISNDSEKIIYTTLDFKYLITKQQQIDEIQIEFNRLKNLEKEFENEN